MTPFGAINDTARRVTVVLDAALMEHDILNSHPLVNTMTTSIARDDLVKFLEATGHPPRIVPVAGPRPGRLNPIAIAGSPAHLTGNSAGRRQTGPVRMPGEDT